MLKSRERIEIRDNGLMKSKEQYTIRENGFFKSREQNVKSYVLNKMCNSRKGNKLIICKNGFSIVSHAKVGSSNPAHNRHLSR